MLRSVVSLSRRSLVTVGTRIPSASLCVIKDGKADVKSTDEIFGHKKVVFFCVPGAFTPVCTSQHLPQFEEKFNELKAKGVDDVLCISVNDKYVMQAWGKHGNVANVTLVADGNGDFVRSLGMGLDLAKAGLGFRSGRFAAVADNGEIKVVKQDAPGEMKETSAESILNSL